MNLTEELDRSFGSGPDHRPIEDRLAAGRRLVRRRRIAATAATVAVVAVAGSTGVALTGANEPSSDPGTTSQPSDEPRDKGFGLEPGQELRLTPDGTLLTADGVEVLERVDNPLGYSPPDHSLGVVYRFEGATHWALATIQKDGKDVGSFTSSEEAGRSFPTFEYWLDDQVALQNGEPTLALVSFGEGETLVPRDGVEILQQTGDAELPSDFAGPDDRTAVAEVTYRGERWYVLARQVDDSPPEYFPSAAAATRPTLEGFLDYAADAYGAGEGLR
jgi:hypothetical protein